MKHTTATGLKLENGTYGVRAVATTAWTEQMTRCMLDNDVVELELNHGKGWCGDSVAFLAKLPRLRAITIIDLRIASVEPIHLLHDLRSLKVITYCKSEIRFSVFRHLEGCALEWRPRAASLFDCTTIKSLFLNRYDGKSSCPFGRLTDLESLAILNAPIGEIQGLSTLARLRSLRLGNLRRLTSLAGIESLTELEEVNINTCRKIRSIDHLGQLSKLRKLFLSNLGDIESLKPLQNLSNLEAMSFPESTNILDGDLSPLLTNKRLSGVSFQNRRHYSHRREEFGSAHGR